MEAASSSQSHDNNRVSVARRALGIPRTPSERDLLLDSVLPRVSVFSEPPQLDVTLDGTRIGKTPVISRDTEPGIHVLRIRDSEKEIIVESGKPFHLSWHRGSFIVVPIEKNKNMKPP